MFIIYQIILSIALILSPFIIILRLLKNKEDKKRFVEKFSITQTKGKMVNLYGFMVRVLAKY